MRWSRKRLNSRALVVVEVRKTGRERALHTAPYTVMLLNYCRLRGATSRCPAIQVFAGRAVAWNVASSIYTTTLPASSSLFILSANRMR